MSISVNRRHVLGMAGLSAGAVALSACGTDSGGTPAASGDASSSAMADAGSITVWIDTNRQPIMKPVAAQFKADTGVTVELVVKDFAKIPDDFITQAPTGKGPDAIIAAHDGTGRLVQNGVVAPIELGDTAGDYQEVAVQAFTYEGKVYGVPYALENIALLRNAELAADAPSDFNAMLTAGRKSVSDGKAKYPFLVGLDAKNSDPYHLYPFQASFDAPVFKLEADGSYDASALAMGGDNGIKFADWLAEQGKAKVLNLNISGDIAKDLFFKGQSPFFVTGPWNLADVKKADIDYAIDPIPSAGGSDATPFVGVQGFLMSAKSNNPVATQRFLVEYIGSEPVQTKLFEEGQRAPANTKAFEAAKSDPDVAAFGEVGAKGVPMPNVPAMGVVWTDWGSTQATIIGGKAADPGAAWAKMVTTIEGKI